MVSLASQSNLMLPIMIITESVVFSNESCRCSPFCLRGLISISYHWLTKAVCSVTAFQSRSLLVSQVDVTVPGCSLTISSLTTMCCIITVRSWSAVRQTYANSLLVAYAMLTISFLTVAPAGITRFFSTGMYLSPKVIFWLRLASLSLLLTITNSAFIPRGALSNANSRSKVVGTLASKVFSSSSNNGSASSKVKSLLPSSTSSCVGACFSSTLRVSDWLVVSLR